MAMADFLDVWRGAADEEILARIGPMVKRMNSLLISHGDRRFVENNEPASVLAAIEVLKERHG